MLSACETGVRRRAAGDEAFGLVRAFLAQGTASVVATLWTVADDSTATLMATFYRELAANWTDVAGALRKAQMEVLASEQGEHPFFWAPFTW